MSSSSPSPPTESSPLLSNGHKPAGDSSATEAQSPADDNDTVIAEEPSTRDLLKVMSSIWLGSFLAALDSTIIATLSPTISNEFNSASLLSWLASAYFIANAALQPLSGKLTDIYGRRAGLVFSNVFFAAGNLICGLATTEGTMIAGRVVAGMGGGGLTAISTFVGSDLVPLRRRGVWQGIGNLTYGLGSGLGGVFGGWANDRFGWRVAFLCQVPLSVLALVMVSIFVRIPVRNSDTARWRRIDFLGAFSLVTTLILLLVGLNSGGNVVPWTHPLILSTLPLSAVSLLGYIWIEAKVASEPVIPVRLFLDRTVSAACIGLWLQSMATFGFIFYGPIYFQVVKSMSATQAGVRLIPQSVGIAVGSLGTGLLLRHFGRYWWINFCIETISVVALSLISTFTVDTPDWLPFIFFFFQGLAYASILTVTLIALIAACEHRFQAVITSASYAFRSTGSVIGVTIASAVFRNILKSKLWEQFGDREDANTLIPALQDNFGLVKSLPEALKRRVIEVYMEALRGVFLTLVGIALIGAMISLFMRENKLHSNLARRSSNAS